jgi:hypothetical protein
MKNDTKPAFDRRRGAQRMTSSPADLFQLVGQPARTAILRALLERRRDADDPTLSFTDLRRAAGIEDNGRFNYHLGELVGTLVTRADDGYRLSGFGFRLLAPLAGGAYDPNADPEPLSVPGSCHDCDASLTVRPEEGVLTVVCERGHVVNHGLIGYPGVISDRDPDDAAAALALLSTGTTELGVAGVCPLCHGHTDGEFVEDSTDGGYAYLAPCEACGNQFATSAGGCVASHPAVVSLFDDHGVDVRRRVPWTLPFRQLGAETVVAEDPLRLRLTVGEELDESLTVTLARDGSVVSLDRPPAAD